MLPNSPSPAKACAVEGCKNGGRLKRGWCRMHYTRWKVRGDVHFEYSPPKLECAFPNCEKKHNSKGYCHAHYMQVRKGLELTPLTRSAISFDQRFMDKISKTETCWEWTGAKRKGYASIKNAGKNIYAHRVAYEKWVGPIPEGIEIDHRCHNTICVNPKHLRLATPKQNKENLRGAQSASASGIRGVSWISHRNKWGATVTHNKITHHLGYFRTAAEAGEAARVKRLELFTHNDIDRRAS